MKAWRLGAGWASHRTKIAVFAGSTILAALWAGTHGQEPRHIVLRHIYGVNALTAVWWVGLAGPVQRSRPAIWPAPDDPTRHPPAMVRYRLQEQAAWTSALWVTTSVLALGASGLGEWWGTWVVLLATLLVLGGIPLAFEPSAGSFGSQLLSLGAGALSAGVVLTLSGMQPPPAIVGWWEATESKALVAVTLVGLYLVIGWGAATTARRRGKT